MDITYNDFWAYENVRRSGVTNMFDVKTVQQLSGLPREKILYIMQHYGQVVALHQPELLYER